LYIICNSWKNQGASCRHVFLFSIQSFFIFSKFINKKKQISAIMACYNKALLTLLTASAAANASASSLAVGVVDRVGLFKVSARK
jgi:hypothetical protein